MTDRVPGNSDDDATDKVNNDTRSNPNPYSPPTTDPVPRSPSIDPSVHEEPWMNDRGYVGTDDPIRCKNSADLKHERFRRHASPGWSRLGLDLLPPLTLP